MVQQLSESCAQMVFCCRLASANRGHVFFRDSRFCFVSRAWGWKLSAALHLGMLVKSGLEFRSHNFHHIGKFLNCLADSPCAMVSAMIRISDVRFCIV